METQMASLFPCSCGVPGASAARRYRRGFTLIELLTVLAILGVLATLLISSIISVRSSADSAHCLSNLRKIGTAIFTYKADNDGKMISYATVSGSGTSIEKYWLDLLSPYLSAPKDPSYFYSNLLSCPSDKRSRALENAQYTDYGLAGLNGILFGICSPQTGQSRFGAWLSNRAPNLATIPYLSQVMMVSDLDLYFAWSTADIENVDKQSWRHNQGINCVFADGHAEWRAKKDVSPDPTDVFWNGGNPDPVPIY